jgi:hypothetical protein
LLEVLFSHDGEMGANCTKQLGDNQGNTIKMTWTVKTAEILGNAVHQHTCLKANRIHLLNFRSKDGVHPQFSAEIKVSFKIAGILVKIFARAKLGWIDKYAYDYPFCPAQGLFHQGEVSLVQIPHGRNKADGLAFAVAFISPPGHLSCGSQYFHETGLLAGEASHLILGTETKSEQTGALLKMGRKI